VLAVKDTAWSLTYTVNGERHVERIPAKWASRSAAGCAPDGSFRTPFAKCSRQRETLGFGPQAREAAEATEKEEMSGPTSHRLWNFVTRRLRLRDYFEDPEMAGGNPDSGIDSALGPADGTDPPEI